jgi:hypothetical protein
MERMSWWYQNQLRAIDPSFTLWESEADVIDAQFSVPAPRLTQRSPSHRVGAHIVLTRDTDRVTVAALCGCVQVPSHFLTWLHDHEKPFDLILMTRDDFVFDKGSWTVVAERYRRNAFNIPSTNLANMSWDGMHIFPGCDALAFAQRFEQIAYREWTGHLILDSKRYGPHPLFNESFVNFWFNGSCTHPHPSVHPSAGSGCNPTSSTRAPASVPCGTCGKRACAACDCCGLSASDVHRPWTRTRRVRVRVRVRRRPA